MTGKKIRERLHSASRVYCTLIVSTSPLWPNYVKSTGVDFVFIDTEHIPIDRNTLAWMCQTYRALNLAPMVRIPEPSAYEACKVIDGGACGVIAPYVESPEQARALVGAVKWRPLKGVRLQRLLEDGVPLEPELARYLEARNENNFVVLNIESVPAIERLDEILGVPGIDAVQIGPHDLSCSLGIPEQWEHPRLLAAISDICRRTRQRGIGFGVHFWQDPARHVEWAREGANLIVHHGDISIFAQALQRDIRQIRESLGDLPPSPASSGDAV